MVAGNPSSASTPLRGAIADAVKAESTEVVFALMGDANMELIAELARRQIKIVFGRHEQGVAGMADGYARFKGAPGVATVTQGPGFTNTVTSLIVSQRRCSPVLLLAGEAPIGDSHNPQAIDQQALARLMTHASGRLESQRNLDELLAEAFRTLRSGHPYILNLPGDVQGHSLAPDWRYVRRYETPQRTCAAETLLDAAADALASAKRPAIIAGQGAVSSLAGPILRELGELLGAPLATTLLANGLFARHRLEAGVAGGLGDGRALRVLEQSDLILAVGASLNQWTTHFGSVTAGRQLVQIDSDPAVFRPQGGPYFPLHGDAAATATAILALLRGKRDPARRARPDLPELLRIRARDSSAYLDTDHTLDPRHFLAELDSRLPQDRSVVIGGGHSAQIACYMLRASSPADWTCTSIDFGALGQGLSVAIGACFARPPRRIIHVTGDGDFMMGLSELDTAIRYSLPLTIFVLNDQGMGQERHNLAGKSLPTAYADYPSPDFAALAEALGARGYLINGPAELRQLDRVLERDDGVAIVDVRINGEYINPMSREIAGHLK